MERILKFHEYLRYSNYDRPYFKRKYVSKPEEKQYPNVYEE